MGLKTPEELGSETTVEPFIGTDGTNPEGPDVAEVPNDPGGTENVEVLDAPEFTGVTFELDTGAIAELDPVLTDSGKDWELIDVDDP